MFIHIVMKQLISHDVQNIIQGNLNIIPFHIPIKM